MAAGNDGGSGIPGWAWDDAHNWKPFNIDALGLITLLGAEEMNAALGRMVPSRYLEYMPLLGAYMIAGDRFREKIPGYWLYNLTVGVTTTDMASWFTRWMAAQDFETTRSYVEWAVIDGKERRTMLGWRLFSACLSITFVGSLVVMTVYSYDWYGFANAISLILSILFRAWILQANRNAIDDAVQLASIQFQQSRRKMQDEKLEDDAGDEVLGESKVDPTNESDIAKIMIVLSDARVVTMMIPNYLIIPVFVKNTHVKRNRLYQLARWIGWVSFAIQVVTIGQAKLACQIWTVAIMVIPTVLTNWKLGCDDSKWKVKFWDFLERPIPNYVYDCYVGSRLRARVKEWPIDHEFVHDKENDLWRRHTLDETDEPPDRSEKRQDLYAWLNMKEPEEESVAKWDLFPHQRGEDQKWWRTYLNKKMLIQGYLPQVAKDEARKKVEEKFNKNPSTNTYTTKQASAALNSTTRPITTSDAQKGSETRKQSHEFQEAPSQGISRSGTALSKGGNITGIPFEAASSHSTSS